MVRFIFTFIAPASHLLADDIFEEPNPERYSIDPTILSSTGPTNLQAVTNDVLIGITVLGPT
jgi:hypothetical protein